MEKDLTERLSAEFGAKQYDKGVIIARDRVFEVARYLRDEAGFDFLRDITSVDWLGRRGEHGYVVPPEMTGRFDVIYQFANVENAARCCLKTSIDDGQTIRSLVSLYPSANYLEREVFDLMGIVFDEHPDLRRILLSDDWEGHPLRKDYPVSGYEMWNWEAHR